MESSEKFTTVGEGLQSALAHIGNIVFTCTSGNNGGGGGEGAGIIKDPILLILLEEVRHRLKEIEQRAAMLSRECEHARR